MARNLQLVVVLSVLCVVAVAATAARTGQQLRYDTRADQVQLKEVAYTIADLTAGDINLVECFSRLPECQAWFEAVAVRPGTPDLFTMHKFLIRLITNTIDPNSWRGAGGDVSIEFLWKSHKLIVKQTPANHEKVAELLAAMRRVLDVEVVLEYRLVHISPFLGEMFSNIADTTETKSSFPGDRQLDERQLKAWMKVFQEHHTTNIMQAPRMTIFNGQQGTINVGDEFRVGGETVECGVFCKTLPVVSIDRKSVQLNLELVFRNLADTEAIDGKKRTPTNPKSVTPAQGANYKLERGIETLSISRNVSIPAGRTIAIPICKELRENPIHAGKPVLSKVPYLNRLFTNVGYGREEYEFFAFVTARVIINSAAASDESHKR